MTSETINTIDISETLSVLSEPSYCQHLNMNTPTIISIKDQTTLEDVSFKEWLEDSKNIYIAGNIKKYSGNEEAKESIWFHRRLSYKLYKKDITIKEFLEQYEKFIRKKLWNKLDTLEGKNLGCWCQDQEKCHGSILIKLFNEKQKILQNPY